MWKSGNMIDQLVIVISTAGCIAIVKTDYFVTKSQGHVCHLMNQITVKVNNIIVYRGCNLLFIRR